MKRASFIGLVQASTPKAKHFFAFISVECERHSSTLRVTSEISCVHTRCCPANTRYVSVASSTNDACFRHFPITLPQTRLAGHSATRTVQIEPSTNLRTRDPSVGVKIRTRARLRGYSSSIPDGRNRYFSAASRGPLEPDQRQN